MRRLFQAEPVAAVGAVDVIAVAVIALCTGEKVWGEVTGGLVLGVWAGVKGLLTVVARVLSTPVVKAEERAQRAAAAERREIHAYLSGAKRRRPLSAPIESRHRTGPGGEGE